MHPSRNRLPFGLIALLLGLMLAACGTSTENAKPETTSPNGGLTDLGASTEADSSPAAEAQTPVNTHCTETDPHPIGQSIAQTFDVDYEEVMTWFCSGYTFDDILIALETSEATGVSVEELLEMSREQSWEDIWDEVGFEG